MAWRAVIWLNVTPVINTEWVTLNNNYTLLRLRDHVDSFRLNAKARERNTKVLYIRMSPAWASHRHDDNSVTFHLWPDLTRPIVTQVCKTCIGCLGVRLLLSGLTPSDPVKLFIYSLGGGSGTRHVAYGDCYLVQQWATIDTPRI